MERVLIEMPKEKRKKMMKIKSEQKQKLKNLNIVLNEIRVRLYEDLRGRFQ